MLEIATWSIPGNGIRSLLDISLAFIVNDNDNLWSHRKAVWEEMGIPPETRTVLEREEREGKGGRVIRGNGIFARARGEAEDLEVRT